MAFIEEHPDALITVVVDATFGHRIDSSEVAEFDAAVANNEVVAPPAGADRSRRRVRAQHRQQGRRHGPLQRLASRSSTATYTWLFDEGRLIGGKPVPHIGWVFVARMPVRGPISRTAVKEARRKQDGDVAPAASAAVARAVRCAAGEPGGEPADAGAEGAAARRRDAAGTAERRRRRRARRRRSAPPKPGGGTASGTPKAHRSTTCCRSSSFVEHHPVGTQRQRDVETTRRTARTSRSATCVGYVPLRLMADPRAAQRPRVHEDRRGGDARRRELRPGPPQHRPRHPGDGQGARRCGRCRGDVGSGRAGGERAPAPSARRRRRRSRRDGRGAAGQRRRTAAGVGRGRAGRGRPPTTSQPDARPRSSSSCRPSPPGPRSAAAEGRGGTGSGSGRTRGRGRADRGRSRRRPATTTSRRRRAPMDAAARVADDEAAPTRHAGEAGPGPKTAASSPVEAAPAKAGASARAGRAPSRRPTSPRRRTAARGAAPTTLPADARSATSRRRDAADACARQAAKLPRRRRPPQHRPPPHRPPQHLPMPRPRAMPVRAGGHTRAGRERSAGGRRARRSGRYRRRRADRHLERQLAEGAPAAGRGVAGRRAARRRCACRRPSSPTTRSRR